MAKKAPIAFVLLALASTAAPAWSADTTVEGTVSGYTCVVLGKACPVDREDPVIAAEKLFVVVKADGTYYTVPNLDRAVLARHVTEKVRVTGKLDEKYRSIKADKLEAHRAAREDWQTVWSQAMEDEARRMLEIRR